MDVSTPQVVDLTTSYRFTPLFSTPGKSERQLSPVIRNATQYVNIHPFSGFDISKDDRYIISTVGQVCFFLSRSVDLQLSHRCSLITTTDNVHYIQSQSQYNPLNINTSDAQHNDVVRIAPLEVELSDTNPRWRSRNNTSSPRPSTSNRPFSLVLYTTCSRTRCSLDRSYLVPGCRRRYRFHGHLPSNSRRSMLDGHSRCRRWDYLQVPRRENNAECGLIGTGCRRSERKWKCCTEFGTLWLNDEAKHRIQRLLRQSPLHAS